VVHGACKGKMRNAYRILVGKLKPGKHRQRLEDNIKMDPKEIGFENVH